MDRAIWASLNSKPAESYALYAGIETRRGARLSKACMVFMQGPGRFAALRARRLVVGCNPKNPMSRYLGGPEHETDHRDRRRRVTAVLHHRVKRGFCRRQLRPEHRRPELFVQRPGQRLARGALRRDTKAVRRKVLRELLRRQALVGDVSS